MKQGYSLMWVPYFCRDTQIYEHQPLIVLMKHRRACKGWYEWLTIVLFVAEDLSFV